MADWPEGVFFVITIHLEETVDVSSVDIVKCIREPVRHTLISAYNKIKFTIYNFCALC